MFEDTKTIILRKPVIIGRDEASITYKEIALREPVAAELAAANNGAPTNIDVVINLISAVSKVPRKAIEQLCQRDLNQANSFLASFSADGEDLEPVPADGST